MAQRPLPDILPIFPLTGVLLLPAMWLPLNVFEPRYRNMVRDVLEGGRHIGLIQPVVPRQDNAPPPEALPENPDVYPVGCAGHVEQWEQTDDGRYLITLKGVQRFRVVEELPLHEGYRRVVPDYTPFSDDGSEEGQSVEAGRLLEALQHFAERHKIPFDMQRLQSVSGVALLNGLAMSLPFGPAEKQALLEADGVAERERMLLTLMGMGIERDEEGGETPPTLH